MPPEASIPRQDYTSCEDASENRQQLIRSGLRVVAKCLFSRDKMASVIAEKSELCWIVAASIKTALPGGPI